MRISTGTVSASREESVRAGVASSDARGAIAGRPGPGHRSSTSVLSVAKETPSTTISFQAISIANPAFAIGTRKSPASTRVRIGMLARVPAVGSSSMTGQSASIETSSSSVTTPSRQACMISSRAGAPP
jgi:hypothetical protein